MREHYWPDRAHDWTRFFQIEEYWANMGRWQKALGGTFIVVVGGAFAFVLVAVLVT